MTKHPDNNYKIIWAAVIGVALVCLGFLGGLVALWWWALAGMSEAVGTAAAVTAIAMVFAGGFVALGALQ